MEHRSGHDPHEVELNTALPPPPRFDAVTSAAARRVKPLSKARIFAQLHLNPELACLINKHSKLLALVATVGLATGAAGGILVERDRQQRFINSSSMNQLAIGQAENLDASRPAIDDKHASSEALQTPDRPPQPPRNARGLRREPRRDLVVFADEDADDENRDEDEDEDEDKNKDKDDDKAKKEDDEDRRKDRDTDRDRKDRDRDEDSGRRSGSRRGALLYDVVRGKASRLKDPS